MAFLFLLLAIVFELEASAQCTQKPNEVDYKITAELIEATQQIHGQETIHVKNNTCTKLSTLYFHVYPNAFRWEMDSTYANEARKYEEVEDHYLQSGKGAWLKVGNIFQNQNKLAFEIEKELMVVHLKEPLEADQELYLELSFITQMAPIAERSGVWDGNYSIGQWFPKLMVYDHKGWALEHNAGYHFTGEFYGDFGSYNVNLIVPQGMKVGATGHRVEEKQLVNGKTQFVYSAKNVHDFAWVADRNFLESTLDAHGIKIHVLVREEESKIIGTYVKDALAYLEKRVGAYPYEDLTIASTYYNGTMEYPQIMFLRNWPQRLARWFERDATKLWETFATHETAHQWFYGMIGNNEVVDAWLDEGFTTYLEESYLRDKYGKEGNLINGINLFKMSDTDLSKIIWRLEEPDITQPIQTPAYLFLDPAHYYSSSYYKTWLFFYQFESLIGREKLDLLLKKYFDKTRFTNASPDDWYSTVKSDLGEEAEGWWRQWITKVSKSDYALEHFSSQEIDGRFKNSFQVSQLGNHFAPVDYEAIEESGRHHRDRVPISLSQPKITLEIITDSPLKQIEIDPDHMAPDTDRFNNYLRLLPKVKVWPFTTRTLPDDSLAVFPLPYFAKRPGIGSEVGVLLGLTHYLDWVGTFSLTKDLRHHVWNIDAEVETLQPDLSWGWSIDYQRDVLQDQGQFMAKKFFGPEINHDPRSFLDLGAFYFGDLGDGKKSLGLGGSFTFSNINNGYPFRYSLKVENALARDFGDQSYFDRASVTLRNIITLDHWIKFDARGFLGKTNGKSGQSALFDFQASDEGAMRFDDKNLKQYKAKTIRAGNFELQFPMPYGSFSDALGFLHGPSWEWHIFSDFSNSTNEKKYFFDAGIGTRFLFASGAYGKIGLNLELVPYQNVINNSGWSIPTLLLNLYGGKLY